MQHGTYFGFDATSPGQGNISSSASAILTPQQKHLMMVEITAMVSAGNQLPNVWISYDFTQPIDHSIFDQSQLEIRRKSSKDWTLQTNDNSSWVTLDSKNNQTVGGSGRLADILSLVRVFIDITS